MKNDLTVIRTPDQRLRVFVSSTLAELADERRVVRTAIAKLGLAPVMFELGARPHAPRALYRAYLEQSHVFVGVYWQSYGWVAPGENVSGLEDEYNLSGDRPKLIYVKSPAPDRDERLKGLLARIRSDDRVSYKAFSSARELRHLVENDLALLLAERFELSRLQQDRPAPEAAPEAGDRHRAGLPLPPTPLVGRERELEAVQGLLLREDVRLVTLTGPGSIGKSRLGLEVAGRLGERFPDGASYVALADVHDESLVVPAIAGAVGVPTSGPAPPRQRLRDFLREKRLLLVLDNFEQVVGAAPEVAELLASAPGVKLLVTSREPLRLRGEQEFPVPPLSLPDADPRLGPDEAERSDAVALFVQRARAVRPDFALTRANVGAVVEICRRLDGLPLALELAAARVRLLTPQAIVSRLDHRLGLLSGGARDLPERQRTLRNTIEWSYRLLNAPEQDLFARLGVFAGGCSLEAVEAVCGGDADLDALELLGSLVDKSLVRQGDAGGEPRFSMLATIREYAAERLRAGPAWRDANDRHAAYFLEFAETAEAEMKTSRQVEWLRRLEREHDNLRAAMAWLMEQDRVEDAVRLAWGLWLFWWFHGHVAEGSRWTEEILARSGDLPPYPRARALGVAGVMAYARADYPTTTALFEKSLRLFREIGNKPGIAGALIVPAQMAAFAGDVTRARAFLEESLALHRELRDDWYTALVLSYLANLFLYQGDYAGAERVSEESLAVSRRLGEKLAMYVSLYNLARVALARGEQARAAAHLREGLTISRDLNDDAITAYYLEAFGGLYATRTDFDRAVRLFAAADALLEAVGAPVYSWSPDRSLQEQAVAAVRSRLGDEAFAAAWAEGRDMGAEQATACALERVEDLTGLPPDGPAPAGPAPAADSSG